MDEVNEVREAVGGTEAVSVLRCSSALCYCWLRQMSSAMWVENGIPASLPRHCCQLAGDVPVAPASTHKGDGKFGFAQITFMGCFQ